MSEFFIFYDPKHIEKSQTNWGAVLNGSNSFFEHCYFDQNATYETDGFYVATSDNNKICFPCIKEKDPQIINIMTFILAGKNQKAKIDKLNIGMEQLRKQIAVSDPAAYKCPICGKKKAYKQSFDGYYGMKCNNCQIGYVGAGLFYFSGKTYNMQQAKKIHKMKAFK